MKRWRELGEVPDSDDESFDDTDAPSQDGIDELPREHDAGRGAEEQHKGPEATKDGDIWSVPSSAPQPVSSSHAHFTGQASQILSQFPGPSQSSQKKLERESDPTPLGGVIDKAAATSNDPVSTPKSPPFPEDEISIGYVRAITPGSRASSPASFLSRTPTPPPSFPRPDPGPPRETTPDNGRPPQEIEEEEGLLQQTAVRLQRSLRPRKPIQQHPYLYENARYTTIMKSHGVKPIKVIPEPQPARRRAEEEDSQDKEFQVEESQDASGEGHSGLGEDGPILFDDEDELALTPSLPKTSPHGQQLRMSSQQTNADQTDATELSDEEFPPLGQLQPVSAKKRQQLLKRQRSQLLSSAQRKRPRFVPDSSSQASPERRRFIPPPPLGIWDLSSSPAEPEPAEEPEQGCKGTSNRRGWRRPGTPDATAQGTLRAGLPVGTVSDSPILINEDTQSGPNDEEPSDATDSSGSDSEVVRQNSRRIRGVLPASWLRLDQRQDKPATQRPGRRTPEPSPERNARRGVALPRRASPRPSSTAPLMLFGDSDESDDEPPPRRTPPEDPVEVMPAIIDLDEDDGASVVEEDTIDWMLPGRKRARSHKTPPRAKRHKRSGAQSVSRGRANVPSWQPKITQVVGRPEQGAASSKRGSTSRGRKKLRASSAKHTSRERAPTPPRLSILDVLEPDAPRFVRIAARSVKKQANLGKASPSKKVISLATRSDNIDALSALRDWKTGKTKPKVALPPRTQPAKPRSRPELREVSANSASRPSGIQPQKLVRQSNLDSFVLVDDGDGAQTPPPPNATVQLRKPPQARPPSLHPAQLEEDVGQDRRRQLTSRKRTLDAFYRKSRGTRNLSTDGVLEQVLDVDFTLREPATEEADGCPADINADVSPAARGERKTAARTKLRKRCRPQQVDPEAPQYTRANDPLPADLPVVEVREHRTGDSNKAQDKLRGLGPYGTHYTHHFEIFPLDRGVFFHESTVIGRGLVRDVVDSGLPGRIRRQRPAVSFSLDGRTLRWSGWDDNVSSEFGILVDWATEQLASGTADDGTARKTIEASDFVLSYILRSLSVQSDLEEKAFVSRCFEVISSFVGRLESVDWTAIPDCAGRTQLEVAVRFSLTLQAVRSLSQTPSGDPLQSMKLDDLLKKLASMIIRRLLDRGTEELRSLYGDLQRSTFRERGIRSDHYLANCWMVVIRLLESAGIPRGSFWDVAQPVLLNRVAATTSDVQTHELLWQDMFTLLPLTEVDNCGILVSGMRQTDPVEGWTLPQQLLKRVFGFYQANPRQPPGFNDYCRALVARCHFLVRQWGWRKCTGIIGTIFDFFGSQNLGHLRNEEVYKSPKFLEELDRSPSLSIEPEDRCFHIFIKLLALAIQRLKELRRVNDVRNLVARTLPNHNRQYRKEDTIHQHDLAALRNHHDLLCTLFWASPPELRPAIHLIEKLVVPGSAHKEACLINVRAWNQLARFVVSSGEGGSAFRPLAAWRNNVFNQVLEQYLSAASDIDQQFRALANKMVGISRTMLDDMVAKNKATALDVLHFSVKASLDVLKRAPTLEVALYALSTGQLQKVFTSLDYQSTRFDWGILRAALDTVEHLVYRIDQASEEHYSSEFAENPDAPYLEDAVLLLNEHLTKDFFWMARTILTMGADTRAGQHSQQAACVEKTVTLAARIAARFIKNRVTGLLPFFSAGKLGLFSDLPRNLRTPERKYLPLFLAVLVRSDMFDFRDLGINILGLWMLSIVKPLRFLGYENYLAEALKHRGLPFLERASVACGMAPDYNTNVDFFACALHHMRRTLRESGSAHSRRCRDEFSKTLQLVMQKMKQDLVLLRPDAGEHGLYIDFVRQVISLVKSHGVGICAVDDFFTQPSADYSPPVQDPQLHAAGIVAYGVKLSEKDANAAPSLFHYLHNSFKMALGNDRLEQECRILGRAMRNAHVTGFVVQFMLPAVVQASARAPQCWALLEVYTAVLGEALDGAGIPRDLADDDVEHAASLLASILAWFASLDEGAALSLEQLHVMTLLVSIANALRPSIETYMLNEPGRDRTIPGLQDTVGQLAAFLAELRHCLENAVLSAADDDNNNSGETISARALLQELAAVGYTTTTTTGPPAGARNPRVAYFAGTIVADVRANWVVSADRVMVRMAGGRGGAGGVPVTSQADALGAGDASLRGTRYGPWERREMVWRLLGELGRGEWVRREPRGRGRGGIRVRDRRAGTEGLLF